MILESLPKLTNIRYEMDASAIAKARQAMLTLYKKATGNCNAQLNVDNTSH